MLPEEKARVKIDKQLTDSGWNIVSRDEYIPNLSLAVKEALMQGGKESDYLLFIDNKAIAVIEAKKEENFLGIDVAKQAENYAVTPENWYGTWFDNLIPLVYLANGKKILFKNMLTDPDGDYIELTEMHSPKKMLRLIGMKSEYGALPRIEEKGLRNCQYEAEVNFENSIRKGHKKALAVLATGSGKTYLACLAAYRQLNYTQTGRVLFLADRNNLARQAETEFKLFDRTEKQQPLNDLYTINRLTKPDKINSDIVISTIQKLFAVLTGQKIDDVFEMVKKVREKSDIPLCFMTYLNVVFHYGYDEFFKKCQEVGIDGIILPDLPYEESQEVKDVCYNYDVTLISMIAPTSKDRVEMIAKEAKGFIYLVSSMGVTGTRDNTSFSNNLEEIIEHIRQVTNTPVAIGFGINKPEQVKEFKQYADGVIVGSAIVNIIKEHGSQADEPLKEYIQSLTNEL